MEQRISLVTLGVTDLGRARAFYEALGWRDAQSPDGEIVFFQAGPMVLALWGRETLAAASGVEDFGGFGGIVLAHNVRTEAEVDDLLARAQTAGGRIAVPAVRQDWGGYSGVFSDPDGHPWEVAHNPVWTLADDGSVTLG